MGSDGSGPHRPADGAVVVNRFDEFRAAHRFVLDALETAMLERPIQHDHLEWIHRERTALCIGANQWAASHGIDKRVTVNDVERVEHLAVGHTDYASKHALYVTELIYGERP